MKPRESPTDEDLFLPCFNGPISTHVASAFAGVFQSSSTLKRNWEQGRENQKTTLQDFLNSIGSHCAACVIRKNTFSCHFEKDCPSLGHTERRQSEKVYQSLKYSPKHRAPCYKCHISSLGNDTLHGPYALGCENPNVMVPIIIIVYGTMKLRSAVAEAGVCPKLPGWSFVKFVEWCQERHEELDSNSMSILHWFATYRKSQS